MKVCTCDACRYTFTADTIPGSCPDCGKPAVRPATESEIREYHKIQEELREEEKLKVKQ